MTGWEWTKVSGAITFAAAVALGGMWLGDGLVQTNYPGQPAYRVTGMTEPPVDLAAAQRDWPGGFDDADESRIHGYLANIEQAVVMTGADEGAMAVAAAPVDLGTLLASADAGRGESVAKACVACHTFDSGGANRVGPNLWAVVGRRVGSHPGFAYSPATTAYGGAWTYERLDAYLASPARAIPGNKMAFGGVRRPQDRAHLLAYLARLSATPAPFPAPKPAADQAAAAPAAGKAS